jgi:hypothetical protein
MPAVSVSAVIEEGDSIHDSRIGTQKNPGRLLSPPGQHSPKIQLYKKYLYVLVVLVPVPVLICREKSLPLCRTKCMSCRTGTCICREKNCI